MITDLSYEHVKFLVAILVVTTTVFGIYHQYRIRRDRHRQQQLQRQRDVYLSITQRAANPTAGATQGLQYLAGQLRQSNHRRQDGNIDFVIEYLESVANTVGPSDLDELRAENVDLKLKIEELKLLVESLTIDFAIDVLHRRQPHHLHLQQRPQNED